MESTDTNQPTPVTPRGARKYGVLALKGFAMGSADVVPGVSGGTMAFILGIYEELINSIQMVGQPEFWRPLLRFRIGEALRAAQPPFSDGRLRRHHAGHHHAGPGHRVDAGEPAGLALELLLRPDRGLGDCGQQADTTLDRRARGGLMAGAVAAFWIVGLVPTATPNTWWFLILSGALASCAMILPGISGSFILVLLGKYEYVINAVNDRDLVSLVLMAIGAVIGLVTLAQLLSWLFKRYHDMTVAVLTGFMIGSLRKVWPWKEVLTTTIDRHGEEVPLVVKNVVPPLTVNGAFNTEIVIALGLMLFGFLLVILIERFAVQEAS